MIFESASPEQTEEFAASLAKEAIQGEVYMIKGDLGAGKTAFARGFARGLGINRPVTSPTFTIVQEYKEGRIPLYHLDVYRIEDPEEMEEVGYTDYFYSDGVALVEWGEMIEELFPDGYKIVTITKDPEKGFDYRRIEVV